MEKTSRSFIDCHWIFTRFQSVIALPLVVVVTLYACISENYENIFGTTFLVNTNSIPLHSFNFREPRNKNSKNQQLGYKMHFILQ